MSLVCLLLGAPVWAQGLDAQSFDPAIDGHDFVSLDDSQVGPQGPGGGFVFNYAQDPLVFRFTDPDTAPEGLEEAVLLSSVATFDLLGYYSVSRYRFGLDVPLNPFASGYELTEGYLMGDIALDAKAELVDRQTAPIGVALALRGTLPTGSEESWLGASKPTIGARAALATGTDVVTTLNLGFRTGTTEVDAGFSVGSQLLAGLGVKLPLANQTWFSVEANSRYYINSSEPVAGFGAEALACLHVNPFDDLVFTIGSGTGLAEGVGTPDFRVVSGLVWAPYRHANGPATSGPDLDADGIPDDLDRCPDQAEDYNGIDDYDGCPDGEWTPTTLFVVGPKGALIAGSRVELTQGPVTGEWVTEAGELLRSLLPGTYEVFVRAEGYEVLQTTLTIPAGSTFEQRLRVEPEGALDGRMVLNVTDIDGLPIEASIRVMGMEGSMARTSSDGLGERSLSAGSHEIVISAPGYKTSRRMVTLRSGGESLIDIVLKDSRVEVVEGRINIYDRIFFEYDSDIIKPESFGILDELSDILKDDPTIQLVEIQGHSDNSGSEMYNLELSQRRADSVRRYVIESGVSSARLVARGYGEGVNLRSGDDDANRRVEFHILKRSGR
ncbi:MAG: OOP family OmpA-OmpF porin [Myxococcota bacterium]|jgi:OOP family OmpA-OmpF porin